MKREIYEVYAKIVDANGNYNTLNGFPKVFDSRSYDNNCAKAMNRAYGAYYACLGTMYGVDNRQCQIAMIIRANDGLQMESRRIGAIFDLPDPDPEPEPEEPGTPEEPETSEEGGEGE